jgi:hypothetical protein
MFSKKHITPKIYMLSRVVIIFAFIPLDFRSV